MQRVCHAKKNQNASKRGTIETSSLRFARSKPQKHFVTRDLQKKESMSTTKDGTDSGETLRRVDKSALNARRLIF